jgi:hypothetical protein
MQISRNTRRRKFVLSALGAALAPALWLQPAAAVGLGEERITALKGTATGPVTSVDPAARLLVLRLPRGETAYRVDPKVQTLGALKPGDTVRVTYGAVIGITVRRGGGNKAAAPAAAASAAQGPASGGPIKGVLSVLSLDPETQMVRLRGPKGAESDFHVRDKADLANVRVGDRVTAMIYELSASDVTPVVK